MLQATGWFTTGLKVTPAASNSARVDSHLLQPRHLGSMLIGIQMLACTVDPSAEVPA
jgi:hypothetical protein